ncbi:type III secretion system protein [Pseudomonas sp.]|uniref:type III secretion system protein n=1 Tax=Pseudomonas sp. TaxID=306 RepID=UPI00262668B8|nr:type III secretion system protein [Pseudomonas sp.]
MTLLRLRHVSSALARARRELGHGAQLGFSTRDEQGVLTLQPAQDDVGQSSPGGFFQSAAGVLHLTEPGAVLSLFGEAPVVVDGAAQAWYWQYINQMLSPDLAAVFAPLATLEDADPALLDPVVCRLNVRLGEESVHAVLTLGAETLLRLLEAGQWHPLQRPLPGDWPIHSPLLLGGLTLTSDELASVRVGDVLLPSHCLFDSEGNGMLDLGGRHWHVATETLNDRLFVHLIDEEDIHHEQP